MNIDFTDPNIQALVNIVFEILLGLLALVLGFISLKAREFIARETETAGLSKIVVRDDVINREVERLVRFLEQTNKINPQDGAKLKEIAMGILPDILSNLGIQIDPEELSRRIEHQVQVMNQDKPNLKFEDVKAITDMIK